MSIRTFSSGLTNAANKEQAGGRHTTNKQEQLTLFHIGIVMDDFDEQRLGQVWVYLPGISARRYAEDDRNVPMYGGTVPDRDREGAVLRWDQKLRLGWLRCAPMFPFFGGDDYRVQRSPDGDIRNATNGDVQSYGFWAQPRIGDFVGVLFANGDPQSGYWIGMPPKYNRNFMVPGSPGRLPQELDDKRDIDGSAVHKLTQQIKEEALQTAGPSLVPTMDKARRINQRPPRPAGSDVTEIQDDNRAPPVELELVDVLASPEFAFNLQSSGLLCDSLRGAGNSSARRESPSYVTGMKSAGWNFDSEKGNLNTASGENTRFQEDPAISRYETIASSGHQFVMDDHPDFQGVRLRTSKGHQIYFNDSCDDPFIYLTTARGKVWIELTDSGKLNIFAEDSVSVHSRKDINLTADRNLNVDVQQDFKLLVRGDTNIAMKGRVDIETGKNNKVPDGLNYSPRSDIGTGQRKDMFVQNYGNVDWSIDNHFNFTIGNESELTGGMDLLVKKGDLDVQVETDIDVLAGDTMSLETTSGRMDFRSGSTMHQTSANQMNLSTEEGDIRLSAADEIHLNSPGSPATDADTANTAAESTEPTIEQLVQVPVAPTEDEIKFCRRPKDTHNTFDDAIVPQHQPWPLACSTKLGFSAFGEEGAPVSRTGATRDDSTHAVPKVQENGVFNSQPFSTNNQEEAPQYELLRPANPGEFNDCSTYTTSERMIAFLKKEEGSRNKAYKDAGKFAIGFGHQINVGDTIFGDTINGRVTAEDLARLRRTGGDLHISDAEKERLLREDLAEFEAAVCNLVTTKITQSQFDAMVSFAYNTGPGNLAKVIRSSNLNSGDFTEVPQKWMQYYRCSGCPPEQRARIESVLQGRRQREIEQFFAYSGDPVDATTGQKSIVDVLT